MRNKSHKLFLNPGINREKYLKSYLTQAIMAVLLLSGSSEIYCQNAQSNNSNDPHNWVDEEFNTDQGLATINANNAYAQGLTGKGIRVGILDSGVATSSGEFSGKMNLSIATGDKSSNGSICRNTTILTIDSCFFASGDNVAVDYMDYNKDTWQSLVDKGYVSEELRQSVLTEVSGGRYNNHGTHVAGTILANRDGKGSQGVAFGADLSTARIFSDTYINTAQFVEDIGGDPQKMGINEEPISLELSPEGSTFTSIYQTMQTQGVRAINNSWGLFNDPENAKEIDKLFNEKNNRNFLTIFTSPSVDNHILQVWAAGNNKGKIAGLLATLPRYITEAEPFWLSVVNVNSNLELSDSSSTCGLSKNWCVAAPGESITSSIVTSQANASPVHNSNNETVGLDVGHSEPQFGYGDMSGTSMAAPHVTGSLALLMERFPYLENKQIRDILLTTATDLGDPGVDDKFGWGLINLAKAIKGPAMLRSDLNVNLNQHPGGTPPNDSSIWDEWSNDISGPGHLTKSGQGVLRLSGNNTFAGIDIQQGGLHLSGNNRFTRDVTVGKDALFKLDGQLNGSNLTLNQAIAEINGTITNGTTTINSGSLLHGNGTLADTVVNGVISPGNSIGKLTIIGNYSQGPSGVYLAEIGSHNQSDQISVTGQAKIDGTLKIVATESPSALDTNYQLLSAGKGIQGQYAQIDTSSLSPFLALKVQYAANSIYYSIGRGAQIALHGETLNQIATASLVDSLPNSHFLVRKLTSLMPNAALHALDTLSGEIYASLPTVLAEQSRVVRDTALQHARINSVESVTETSDNEGARAWARIEHTNQQIKSINSKKGALPVHSQESIPFIGADFIWQDAFRIGGIAGSGHSTVQVHQNDSRSKVKANYLGAYFSRQWNHWNVLGGITQASQTLHTLRHVKIDTQTIEDLTAKHDATTRQFFLELNTQCAIGQGAVEPFGQFSHVRVAADGVEESGGNTRLLVNRQTVNTHIETVGVRFNSHFLAQPSDRWTVSGALAYRHTGGDTASTAKLAFPATQSFRVIGANQGKNAAVGDLGLTFYTTPHSQLKLGYTGIFSRQLHESEGYLDFSLVF